MALLSMGALAGSTLQIVVAMVPQVTWRTEPGLKCPTARELQRAYSRLSAQPAQVAPIVTALVEVGQSSAAELTLDVRLSIPDLHQSEHRGVYVGEASCKEMAQTVAILIHAWLNNLGTKENARAIDASAAVKPSTPVMAAAPVEAEDHRPTELARIKGTDGPARSWLGLTLGLGADLWLASNSSGPSVTVSAELRVSKSVAVGLLASWISDLSVTDPPYGSITVQRQLFGVSTSWAIPGVERLAMEGLGADLVAALILWHGQAQSFAYPVTVGQELFDPGLLAGARLRQRIGSALFLQAQVAAVVLSRSYTFDVQRTIGEATVIAAVPAFALDVGLGAGVQIF